MKSKTHIELVRKLRCHNAAPPLSEEIRREAHINELCGSEEWTQLLHRAANVIRAAEDFVWNVEHSHVAGFGDLRKDVCADESFKVLKASLSLENASKSVTFPSPKTESE